MTSRLSQTDFDTLTHNGTVLEQDGHGIKVVKLADGRFLKLFRLKSWYSSARWYNYAKRFANNAAKLTQLGIATVSACELVDVPHLDRRGVIYTPLAGSSYKDLSRERAITQQEMTDYFAFIAKLHGLGVYFRSLHIGNIIRTPEGGLGLIDIADMRFQRRSLNLWQRRRNFAHLFRYRDDMQHLLAAGKETAIDAYLVASELPKRKQQTLRAQLLAMLAEV
jgi:hypothetical protein